jgi:hypothetical protein
VVFCLTVKKVQKKKNSSILIPISAILVKIGLNGFVTKRREKRFLAFFLQKFDFKAVSKKLQEIFQISQHESSQVLI